MFEKFFFIMIGSLMLAGICFLAWIVVDFFYEVPRTLKKILKVLEEKE